MKHPLRSPRVSLTEESPKNYRVDLDGLSKGWIIRKPSGYGRGWMFQRPNTVPLRIQCGEVRTKEEAVLALINPYD